MSCETSRSAERILNAAFELFLQQGVRKTTLDEVGRRAGVTRVTVYRCYADKRGLVAAVCQRLAEISTRAARDSRGRAIREIDARLTRLGHELSELPRGNLLACLEEIRRLYPDVYREFRTARDAAHDALFRQVLASAKREGALRAGLHVEVVRAIFELAVVRLLEDPTLISSNVALAEVFETVTAVFRHGILHDQKTDET